MFLLLFLMAGFLGASAQSSTLESEVPGDNFSLEGALELFKKSASPEEFEKKLNAADSKVNNLDLNNDGNIDYIRVIDRNEGNVHAFILQAVLSETESQDVAVIELEKLENGRAVLQIVGDADVYGIETIIEPTEEVRVNAGTTTSRAVVNVWMWPSVQYVYGPYYSPWVSPWSWAYYPVWWRPWRPVAFHIYHPWWTPYRPYYSYCYTRRVYYGPDFYRPYRRTSVIVYNNYRHQIDRYRTRNDRYHNSRRDRDGYGRYDGGRYNRDRYNNERGRVSERYSGRDRSDGRDRFADGRRTSHSETGRGTVTRDNSLSRYEGKDNVNERRSTVRGGNESDRSKMSSPEKNSGRSSSTLRTTPNSSSNFNKSRPAENSVRQAPSQQPSRTFSSPGRSSSPSYRGSGSSGSRQPSINKSGGSRSNGGGRGSGGDRGGSGNSRGRH